MRFARLLLALLTITISTSIASAACNPPKFASTYNSVTGAYSYWHTTIEYPWAFATIWTGATDHTGTCNDFGEIVSTETLNPGDIGMNFSLGSSCVPGCPSGLLAIDVRAINYANNTEEQMLLVRVPESGPGSALNFDFSNTAHALCDVPRPVIQDLSSNGSTKTATVSIGSMAACAFGDALREITGWNIRSKASSTQPTIFDSYGLRGSLAVTPGSNGSASGTVTLDCSNAALDQWVTAQLVTGGAVLHLVGPTTRVRCQSGPASCSGFADGTTCDDGNACTLHDTCQGGICNAGIDTRVCDDGNVCTLDSCDPIPGCVHTADSCNDNNPCTDDACDSVLGCGHTNNTKACDDGSACTSGDTCQNGACAGVTSVVCMASDQCHLAGTCSPSTGVCSSPPAPDGTGCHDIYPCTTGDICTNGVCSGTPVTPPPETQNLSAAADKATYSWSAAASATRYDVVRGSVAALPVGPGGGDETCFDNVAGTSLNDPVVPAPGTGFWYVSRGQNACLAGTFGTRSNGSPRATATCP